MGVTDLNYETSSTMLPSWSPEEKGMHAGILVFSQVIDHLQNHQETARHIGRSLHNSTDFEPDPIRENLVNSTAYGRRSLIRGGRYV